MKTSEISIKSPLLTNNSGVLQLSKIVVDEDYLKKWNSTHYDNFCVLTSNGNLIRNTLYRVGGLNNPNLDKDKYFLLIKYIEAYYNDDITTDKNKKPHLKGKWCILNSSGEEMIEFEQFTYPSLIKDSVIYRIDSNYHNIETGELYCMAFDSVESKEYLFLENNYDDDKSKRGVMMINKKDGTYKLFPK